MDEPVAQDGDVERGLAELRRGRKSLLLFVFVAALASGLAVYRMAAPERVWIDPADVAQQFLSDIKHGESVDGKGRTGYERAYDLLSEDACASYPWPEFLTTFALLARDHGPIQSSEAQVSGVRRHRSDQRHSWVLYCGRSARVHRAEMERFLLTVDLTPVEGGFAVSGFVLEPAP